MFQGTTWIIIFFANWWIIAMPGLYLEEKYVANSILMCAFLGLEGQVANFAQKVVR